MIQYTQRIGGIAWLKSRLSTTGVYNMMYNIGRKMKLDMIRNIQEEGIWDKWEPFSHLTTVRREHYGKNPIKFFGFISRIQYDIGMASVKIGIHSPYAKLHDRGTSGRGWLIPREPKEAGEWISYPVGDGKWMHAKQVRHPGIKQRTLLIPHYVAREIARDEIRGTK